MHRADTFMEELEGRLDTIIYRAHFAKTVGRARQLILNGYIKVNGSVIKVIHYKVGLVTM